MLKKKTATIDLPALLEVLHHLLVRVIPIDMLKKTGSRLSLHTLVNGRERMVCE